MLKKNHTGISYLHHAKWNAPLNLKNKEENKKLPKKHKILWIVTGKNISSSTKISDKSSIAFHFAMQLSINYDINEMKIYSFFIICSFALTWLLSFYNGFVRRLTSNVHKLYLLSTLLALMIYEVFLQLNAFKGLDWI